MGQYDTPTSKLYLRAGGVLEVTGSHDTTLAALKKAQEAAGDEHVQVEFWSGRWDSWNGLRVGEKVTVDAAEVVAVEGTW